LLAGLGARAHDPFDISSRMTVYENRIELISTMGSDAMRQLLTAAGRTPEEIVNSLRSSGPEITVVQPITVAARFFQLKNTGSVMVAKSVASRSEGMEIFLTVIYSRPASGIWMRERCAMKPSPGYARGVDRRR